MPGSPATYARAGWALGYAEHGPASLPLWAVQDCQIVMGHAADHPALIEVAISAGRLSGRRAALEAQRERLYAQHGRVLHTVTRPVAATVSAHDLVSRARQAGSVEDAQPIVAGELDRAVRVSGQQRAWDTANGQAATAAAVLGAATAAASRDGTVPTTDAVDTLLPAMANSPAAAAAGSAGWTGRQAAGWATDLARAARTGSTVDEAADAVATVLDTAPGVVWWAAEDMHAAWTAGFAVTAMGLDLAVNYCAMPTACLICLDNAAASPYASADDAPFIPAHGGCRCWLETISRADAAF